MRRRGFSFGPLFRKGRLPAPERLPVIDATPMGPVVACCPEAILLLDERGAVEALNRAARKLFSRGPARFHGRHVDELVRFPRTRSDLKPPTLGSRERLDACEALGLRPDGSTFPIEIAVAPVQEQDRRRRAVFVRDLTRSQAERESLSHRATHDALTELPNRELLERRGQAMLEEAVSRDQPVAVLFLDLDRFKDVNDALGHHTGDLLLERVARRLEAALEPEEVLARVGGDEFVIVVPEAGTSVARRKAMALGRALREPFRIGGITLELDCSIGVAFHPDHGSGVLELIQRADVAMFAAKRKRSRVAVYQEHHDVSNLRQHRLAGDLRRAIENNELGLHYQPKLSAETGCVIGVEALARWDHPDLGPITPDEFIALAERTGLIQPLTRWVMETATVQGAQWRREGYRVGISINVSARSLLEERLPRLLERLLGATGFPAGALTLEITESSIMEDPERALEVMIELYALGVGLAIDDFGTGYSSLGYLKRLPASELKIDKSFVTEMDRNRDDATIVRSVIDLAHNLGVHVVAEGVETEPVWEELRRLGCDVGQGYLFSRPLPPDRFVEWLRGTEGTRAGLIAAQASHEPAAVEG